MIISSRTGPGAFCRSSTSSVAGTRAGWREGSSDRLGGASVRSGDAAQAGPGSKAAAGMAAGGGTMTGGEHPSMSEVASWSNPCIELLWIYNRH